MNTQIETIPLTPRESVEAIDNTAYCFHSPEFKCYLVVGERWGEIGEGSSRERAWKSALTWIRKHYPETL